MSETRTGARLPVVVEPLNPGSSSALADWRSVLGLAKRYSGTLGFLSASAFKDRAKKQMLLIARQGEVVVGYCIYDVPRAGHIKLVHVCVDAHARKVGTGKPLIDAAVERHPGATGVLADCRRDYKGVDKFWIAAGLAPRG